MKNSEQSLCERAAGRLAELAREHKTPLIATWVAGLLAHMFVFTNKLINQDELVYLFKKGETIKSGRWMLELTSIIFPDVSMPWIYGVISLALISVAICLVVRIFNIRSRLLQILLAGIMVSFPAQDSIFCFMFTSAPYALALFGSVLSVYIFTDDRAPTHTHTHGAALSPLVCCAGVLPRNISELYSAGGNSVCVADDIRTTQR